MNVELVARSSLSSLQKTTNETFIVSPGNFEDWAWPNLRKQFKCNNSLERLYLIYRRRLENGYMSLFVVLQLCLGIVNCLILISTVAIKDAMFELVVCGLLNALLFPIIALSFRLELIVRKTYLPVFFSCLIIALLVIGDSTVAIYHTLNTMNETLSFRPAHATHTLLVCYIFLPISSNLHAFILGVTTSLCYLASFWLITFRNDPDRVTKIFTDFMYHACINCLGLYFRFMNEIMIRQSFLDHRKYVESTLRLNYEKDQEEQLTQSILPPHIASKIKKNFRDICKFIEEHKSTSFHERRFASTPSSLSSTLSSSSSSSSSSISKDLYVEIHENVSILYADVVNFSGLTITLPVKKLVETLNNLFGSFDEASERHNVLRIKFLGDCYYCVSGVPLPNSQHAKSCVDLGLDMISIINGVHATVQRECGVDVSMRIGVHSGKIISGILGINKWQYDVWSRDVIIANKMEQTGEAGKVHITQQTLDLLDINSYVWKPVVNLNDSVLYKYGIFQSYLITPKMLDDTSDALNTEFKLMFDTTKNATSLPENKLQYLKGNQKDARSLYAYSFRKRTHFMGSSIRDYLLMLKAADAEMEKAIQQMPLSKWEQWCKWDNINPIFLTFSQIRWEIPYFRERDPLFKFYIVCIFFILLFIGSILFIPMLNTCDCSWQSVVTMVVSFAVALIFIIILMPITWTQFLWRRYKKLYEESENNIQQQPSNKILNFFYQSSVKVVWSAFLRISLFCIITAIVAMTAIFNLLVEYNMTNGNHNNTSKTLKSGAPNSTCISTPWQLTETCVLAIFSTFIFLRIHFLLKLCTGILIATFYAWIVWDIKYALFESNEETWNPHFGKRLSHILTVSYLTFSLHLIDRQAEYLNRLDYLWKRQLAKEQNEAFHTKNANKLLLRNILPEHVADFYLNMDRTEENALYHEAHDHVAVMFATLTDLLIDESNILVDFNEIICHFDKLLFEPNYMCRIEKIKLAGTTYMAACGLETSKFNSSQDNATCNSKSNNYNVIRVMVQFAAEMMATLEKIKVKSHKSYNLRIGVSHGEVTAGVVGAHKPLYDIWGDAVNMASRMDTTGEAGKIQVTKDTAKILEDEGIKCHLRGETYVKPKGLVTTYYVGLNEKMELEKIACN